MSNEVKLRLEEDEVELLNQLVESMRSKTKMYISRTAIAHACFRHGWLVMQENYGHSTANTSTTS